MSSLADRLLARLEVGRASRIPVARLQELVLELEPALRTSPLKRERLAEAIEEAVGAGRLRLPAQPRLYGGHPPLPAWVRLIRDSAVRPGVAVGDYFWRPELAWASELRLRPGEAERLARINQWLRDRPADEPVVPVRERSMELFGDEKLLERLGDGRLFLAGRLSLDLLRARSVHPPFVSLAVSNAPVLLVIENHHTYDSFARLLGPSSGVGILAYGAGSAFVGSVTYAADLPQTVEDIRYFGDLDARGLRIPADADRARGANLPPVRPAARLYERLLEVGVAGAATPVGRETAAHLVAWLPPHLRDDVVALLVAGRRMAQEAVGYKALRAWLEADPGSLLRS